VICRRSEPSAAVEYSCVLAAPGTCIENTIRDPSGDQSGRYRNASNDGVGTWMV
jgi:hypothetical protein